MIVLESRFVEVNIEGRSFVRKKGDSKQFWMGISAELQDSGVNIYSILYLLLALSSRH